MDATKMLDPKGSVMSEVTTANSSGMTAKETKRHPTKWSG